MSLETNAEFLHGINPDKRPSVEFTDAEKAYDGHRISLTFRHISTFLSKDEKLIWGQGATGKFKDDARPVVNGNPEESEKLVKAFGAENQASSIDWHAADYHIMPSNLTRWKKDVTPVHVQKISTTFFPLNLRTSQNIAAHSSEASTDSLSSSSGVFSRPFTSTSLASSIALNRSAATPRSSYAFLNILGLAEQLVGRVLGRRRLFGLVGIGVFGLVYCGMLLYHRFLFLRLRRRFLGHSGNILCRAFQCFGHRLTPFRVLPSIVFFQSRNEIGLVTTDFEFSAAELVLEFGHFLACPACCSSFRGLDGFGHAFALRFSWFGTHGRAITIPGSSILKLEFITPGGIVL
ncbi:hypothetical protein KC362_g21 [Hortaea werneckii]|nr:hypothetical protein KC362_g21 [Hortaea werneckii]